MPYSNDILWTDEFYQAIDPKVLVVGYMTAEPGHAYTTSRSLLTDFDLWYITAGRGSVRLDDTWIDFAQGDLLLLKPGQHYHEDRADPDRPFSQYWTHLLPFSGRRPALSRCLAECWPTRMNVDHVPALAPLFADLFETFTTRTEGHPLRMKALVHQVFDLLFPLIRRAAGSPPPPRYPKFLAARNFIEARFREPLTLDQVAEHADLSASYLLALSKRFLGCSPMHYQTLVRIRAAKVHLGRGDSVTRTAEAVGFNSLHYFSRTFTRIVGQTPSQFARQSRWR
ncbi:MAG TPA: AraC family transcriptional regulator [Phycisphaerae bacterium]|nr:AraC family transcriptional regulator [Phycisphaerae bacterium]HOI54558.1 AraC family transcriptional regulator [Phycisphaerae bacterium]